MSTADEIRLRQEEGFRKLAHALERQVPVFEAMFRRAGKALAAYIADLERDQTKD